MIKHTYGLIRQKKDERDYSLTKEDLCGNSSLPAKVDLRNACPPVFDQSTLGSCTANAGVAAFMMLKKINVLKSRLFLYYVERYLENAANQDQGAQMRDIGKALNKFGVCDEALWSYHIDQYAVQPSKPAYDNAATNRILSYKGLSGITQLKQYLFQKNQPILMGMDVYESFESDSVAKTGMVPIPNTRTESILGGHAVLIVGYDDNLKQSSGKSFPFKSISKILLSRLFNIPSSSPSNGYFIVRNSWGENWADQGYFYLPYDFVTRYAYDFWVLQD